tara:strand:+ start:153 stop:1550 length:1398 start_codon:yes stop_codon:yes gene_type:complete
MSDLDNQVENTEELVVEKAPTDGAEKGDKSAHKQGSSSEEKIESGKAEVVKPEENPVDKAVASVKAAEKGTKPVSDAVNKGAEKGDSKADKLKEDEDSNTEDTIVEKGASKMELIKAAVDSMKGLNKEELNKLFASLSEDEVDESLTKAEIARNIVEALKALSLEEVQKLVKEMGYEDEEDMEDDDDDDDDDDDEDEDDHEESVKKEEAEAGVESSLVEIEIDDDLSKISESLELSEENAEKAKTIFKAAVNSKVEEAKAQLEEHYQSELKSQVETVKEELSSSVDKYLTYCAEEWTKENELAIERGLRSEMTENFIEGLKKLFVEHYVEVPEDKYDVMDELANRLDEMESKLDAEVSKNMEITEELGSLKRQNVVTKACEDLSESQKEKMVSLSNGVDFTDEADFEEKVAEIKEAYFGVESETIAEETVQEEGTGEFEVEGQEKVLDPSIARYSEALSKLKPLG